MSPLARIKDPRYLIQKQAQNAVLNAFKKHRRTQLVMACGSGKTFVSLLVAEKGGYKKIVILMPSLALVEQVLREYRECASWKKWDAIAVCSDPTVANDEISIDPEEVDCEVTTERSRVVEFLKGSGVRVVFCTYHSAEVLSGLDFELGIFDEAHKTAGSQGKAFAYALSDENIEIEHRLFMTATPKHVEIKNEDGDEESVFSMDDKDIYGSIAYRLGFREAIQKGIICDYEIAVCPLIYDVNTNGYKPAQVALRKAMVNFGSDLVITFHSSIKRAQEFADDNHKLFACPKWHVNGEMSTSKRKEVLRGMIEQGGVVTNVRCLSEGVDFPTVDMVGFIDPKRSTIDIIQAVGRCLRTDRKSGKKNGIVLVPIYIKQGQTDDEAIANSKFEAAIQVIQAIKEQDELFAEELRYAGQAAVEGRDPELERITVIGDDTGNAGVSVEELNRAIMVRLVRATSGVNSADVNKKKLFEMGDRGEKRPDSQKTNIGMALVNYTGKLRETYDADFDCKIRKLAPHWFIDTAAENKKKLFEMVREDRPNWKIKIGQALVNYTGKFRETYDADFDCKIRKLAPHWFVDTVAENKKKLFKMGDRGKKRPSAKTKIGKSLCSYLSRNQSQYDVDFDHEIHKRAPHWFIDTAAENKKQLLEMVQENKPSRKIKLGEVLKSYISKSSACYDADFDREIRKFAPHWFRK